MLFFLLLACWRADPAPPGPLSPPEADADADADTDTDADADADTDADTDSDTDPTGLKLGAACDPEADLCAPGGVCCTACCRPDATPVCTPPEDDGITCPLPDLVIDPVVLEASLVVEDFEAEPDSCAILDGCLDTAGSRRLLRFTTSVVNSGTADLILGPPGDFPGLYTWSDCHGHYHFEPFAAYRLLAEDGSTVVTGHKMAFCLMDSYDQAGGGDLPTYDCNNQGISVGWADLYAWGLDCQWVDITGVPAGEYTLEVGLDPKRGLSDRDFGNDFSRVGVRIEDP